VQIAEECGRVTPVATRGNHNAQIRFYEKAIDTIDERAACWAKKGPQIARSRAMELAFLAGIRDDKPTYDSLIASNNKYAASLLRTHTLENELEWYERKMKYEFPRAEAKLRRSISSEKGYRQTNRESWARAANMAVNDFARSNPFNTPQPGIQNITRTSTLIPNASPATKVALDSMDRSMFGDKAYYSALARDMSRSYSNRPAPNNTTATFRGGQATITLTKTERNSCYAGSKEQGNCITYQEARTQHNAQMESMERDLEQLNIATYQHMEAARALSNSLAMRRRGESTEPMKASSK